MARGVLDSVWTRRGGEHGAARTGPEGQRRAGNAGGGWRGHGTASVHFLKTHVQSTVHLARRHALDV